jgi:hypothetical protein
MATQATDSSINRVEIRVINDGDGRYHVEANPEDVPVQGRYVVITFVLVDSPGWQFERAGAVTITTSSTQFPLASATSEDNLTVKLFDFNSDSQEYHYNVSVSHPVLTSGRSVKLIVDPGIKNGM